ncbi:MAG: sigma-70 family RNA polymerase sigma factor [Oscillospiraceae bacterium]|nr:sigma-70 family RNA polymerase sigma factor [Oscillospiraceae bacterium]
MDFDEIFRGYAELLYKYMLKLSRSEDIAEEIVQETFCKAIINSHKFKGECKVTTWLCQIARNEYLNYIKKKERSNLNIDDFSAVADERRLEDIIEDRETAFAARAALRELPETVRELFELRASGLSFREIGDIYGKTENWARVTFFRAKQKIIEKMEEQGYEV